MVRSFEAAVAIGNQFATAARVYAGCSYGRESI